MTVRRDHGLNAIGADQVKKHVGVCRSIDENLLAGGPAAEQVGVVVIGADGNFGEHQSGQLPDVRWSTDVHISRVGHPDSLRLACAGVGPSHRARGARAQSQGCLP